MSAARGAETRFLHALGRTAAQPMPNEPSKALCSPPPPQAERAGATQICRNVLVSAGAFVPVCFLGRWGDKLLICIREKNMKVSAVAVQIHHF